MQSKNIITFSTNVIKMFIQHLPWIYNHLKIANVVKQRTHFVIGMELLSPNTDSKRVIPTSGMLSHVYGRLQCRSNMQIDEVFH
jgi:hypothetical protein